MKVDIGGANVNIEYDHHKIHQGELYSWGDLKNSMVAGATQYYGFITGAKEVHTRPARITPSADKLTMYIYEGSSFTGGTPITPVPHNRNYSVPCLSTIVKAPTVTAEGNLFVGVDLPGSTGAGQTRSNVETTGQNEYVLKPNTKYLVKMVNSSTDTNVVTLTFSGYEE